MTPNPVIGILFHAIGGFAAGSFYSPLKKIRGWSWETAWLMMGLAAWLTAPWIAACLTTPQLRENISQAFATNSTAIGWAVIFGFVWGFGNVTYGMANRYLGIALGGSIAVGFCMLFGTLIPPIFQGTAGKLLHTTTGQVVLGGVLLCGFGIALCGLAGRRRELELSSSTSGGENKEFRLALGLFVAVLAGVL